MIKAHRLLLEGNLPAILIYYDDEWQEEKSSNDTEYGNTVPIKDSSKKEPEVTPVSEGNVTRITFGKKKTITKFLPDDGPLLA